MSLISPNRGYPLEKLEGSRGSMVTWVTTFDNVADGLGELRARAQRVSDLPGVGDSITRARDDARALLGPARSGVAEAEVLSRVLAAYADAYSASAEPANRMIEEIEDAHATWERATDEAERAGANASRSSRSGSDATTEAANHEAHEATAAQRVAKAVLDDLWETWERYYAAWDEAYDAALSSLASGVSEPLTNHERALLDALLASNDPGAVLALWNDNPEVHDVLAAQFPDIIGNLDGIPYAVRADINLRRLTVLHDDLQSLAEPLQSEVTALWEELHKHRGALVSFDPSGSEQLTAAVWYGPLDAQNVSALVPGMLSEVTKIGEFGQSARELIDGTGDAAVAWFGYDSPDYTEEPSMSRAEDGAPALRSFLLGLDAQAGSRTINVIAHSYGSTTAGLAIGSAPDGLGVDRFIMVGSAGLPDDDAVLSHLQAPGALRIYATTSDNDFWAPIGQLTGWGHSTSPTSLDGAIVFDSDGGIGAAGEKLRPTPGHSAHSGANFPGQQVPGGYLEPGSESFYNVRSIVMTGELGTEVGGEGSVDGLWDVVAVGLSAPGLYGY